MPKACSPATAPDQLDARGDVPPLVASAELDAAAPILEEAQEVVGLEHLVAELGERDAGVGSSPCASAPISLPACRRGKVLADISQEADMTSIFASQS
jgi:hypothetical protein